MSLALETICGKFGMTLTDDPATRVVASKIIELAQRGVRDAPTLSEALLTVRLVEGPKIEISFCPSLIDSGRI
jgi:hypothetical protein